MLAKLGLNKTIGVSIGRYALYRNTLLRPAVLASRFSTVTPLARETPYIKIDALEPGESELLIQQRKQRPISPHLTIYQPQLTWYLSSVHRVSLLFMGAGFYLLTILFGVATIFNLGDSINTEKLTNWYHNTVSKFSQLSLKTTFAYLFAFHYALSVRHLLWDAAKELSLKGVYRTGYAAIAFGTIVGTYLLSL